MSNDLGLTWSAGLERLEFELQFVIKVQREVGAIGGKEVLEELMRLDGVRQSVGGDPVLDLLDERASRELAMAAAASRLHSHPPAAAHDQPPAVVLQLLPKTAASPIPAAATGSTSAASPPHSETELKALAEAVCRWKKANPDKGDRGMRQALREDWASILPGREKVSVQRITKLLERAVLAGYSINPTPRMNSVFDLAK